VDATRTEWREGKRSLSGWHRGASELFSGTQVITIFYNGIQVKASVYLQAENLPNKKF
jgi:hypothetical protein